MTTKNLIEALNAWGCNTAKALNRLSGDAECYMKCVRMEAEELDGLDELWTAVAQGDCLRAFEITHYFKGSLATLELAPLLAPVSTMTELFRAGTLEGAQPLEQELRKQKAQLDTILGR